MGALQFYSTHGVEPRGWFSRFRYTHGDWHYDFARCCSTFWSRHVSNIIFLSVLFAIGSSVIGLLISYHANLPSGPAVILSAGGFYVISMLIGTENSWRNQYLQFNKKAKA